MTLENVTGHLGDDPLHIARVMVNAVFAGVFSILATRTVLVCWTAERNRRLMAKQSSKLCDLVAKCTRRKFEDLIDKNHRSGSSIVNQLRYCLSAAWRNEKELFEARFRAWQLIVERGCRQQRGLANRAKELGTLGTASGALLTFAALGRGDESLVEVLGGLVTALATTLAGLACAIPIERALDRFTAELDRLVANFELAIAELATRYRTTSDENHGGTDVGDDPPSESHSPGLATADPAMEHGAKRETSNSVNDRHENTRLACVPEPQCELVPVTSSPSTPPKPIVTERSEGTVITATNREAALLALGPPASPKEATCAS